MDRRQFLISLSLLGASPVLTKLEFLTPEPEFEPGTAFVRALEQELEECIASMDRYLAAGVYLHSVPRFGVRTPKLAMSAEYAPRTSLTLILDKTPDLIP